MKQNDFANKNASGSRRKSLGSATKLQIYTAGALENRTIKTELNTKWLNSSSGDRCG